MIVIDGARGEGGGQVLRSALSLSACTGQPFRIKNVRAGRQKPGLMRQHLTCVRAAEAVCGGSARGAELGGTELTFAPGEPRGGTHRFDVGTAGATPLVFQTVLPILLSADEPSRVTLCGGTHTMAAPTLDFVTESFLPPLNAMGADVTVMPERPGFFPAGGGLWSAEVSPLEAPAPLDLTERGALLGVTAQAMRANLSGDICERELAACAGVLGLDEDALSHTSHGGPGPGNAVLVRVACAHHRAVFSDIGRRGVSAEAVGRRAAGLARGYLEGRAVADEHLADQLLLPLALFGGGRFTASVLSSHFATNAETIGLFLDIRVRTEETGDGWLVEVERG